MKKLTISLMLLFAFVLAVGVFASVTNTFVLHSPADGSFQHNGNLTFNVTVQVAEGRNVTNVSIWHNMSGSWQRDQNLSNNSLSGFASRYGMINLMFRNWTANLSDGDKILWGVEVRSNSSAGDYQSNWSVNYTLHVEFPPNVTINYPNMKSNFSDFFLFNFTSASYYIPPNELNDSFTCDVLTNATGEANLTFNLGRRLVNNGSNQSMLVNLPEAKTIGLTVKCWETLRPEVFAWSTNITVGMDKTGPKALFETNISNGITKANSVQVNYTITDLNPEALVVYLNGSGNAWTLNYSSNSLANGTVVSFNLQNLSDGDYAVGGYLWDIVALADPYWIKIPNVTSNLTHNATLNNHTFTIDTIAPAIANNTNLSQSALLTVAINWTTSEPSNGSISYGNVTKQHTSWVTETASYMTAHAINITVEEGKTYYYNITSCDRAGNCNSSVKEFTIAPQSAIYAGWSAFTIFDSTITMGAVYNDSGADYVYLWNASSQGWVAHTGGVGSQASTVLYGGSVVWLFKSVNGTWTRDVNVRDAYRLNLSSGINFVGAQFDYNFTNLSVSFFNRTAYRADSPVLGENNTVGGTANGLGAQVVDVAKMEFFSIYNNSDQRYISYFRNETFNNATIVPRGWVIFVGAGSNATWNGTSIVTNWTISG